MKIGVANKETWIFLEDIYAYLDNQYETQIFRRAAWPLPVWQPKMSHYMLRRSLKQFIHDCDVVLFEWASELLVEASDVYTPEAGALVTRLHRYEMFEWVERINWNNVSYVILDTEAMRHKLLDRTNVNPERALVLPNAVPLSKTDSSQRPFEKRIGILANLHPRKRIYELVLAFYAVLQEEPDMTLHIGGPPRANYQAYHEAIHDLVRRLGIEDKVAFYGKVEDRWEWYQTIDIFISISYSEGMQVAPIEAAASGCYCLSHWWEGADEIFPREQLFVTEREFVERVMAYVRGTQDERRLMRQPFLSFVENDCNLDRVSRNIEDVLIRAYEEKIAAKTRASS